MHEGVSLGVLNAVPAGATSVLGVLALVLYIGGYLALQLGLIRGDGWQFPAINSIAAFMMISSLLRQFNPYSLTMEVAWVVISIVGLVRLYIIHKYFRFTEEEQAAAQRLVPGLAKDRARKLLSRGAWSDVAAGRVLTREGEPVTHLVYLAEGMCRIEIDGAMVAILGPGVLDRRDDLPHRPARDGDRRGRRAGAHPRLRAQRPRSASCSATTTSASPSSSRSPAISAASSPTRPASSPWTGGAPAPRLSSSLVACQPVGDDRPVPGPVVARIVPAMHHPDGQRQQPAHRAHVLLRLARSRSPRSAARRRRCRRRSGSRSPPPRARCRPANGPAYGSPRNAGRRGRSTSPSASSRVAGAARTA